VGAVKHLLCFGFGFSAQALARQLDPADWRITATSRSAEGLAAIAAAGVTPFAFSSLTTLPDDVTHLLSSAPPSGRIEPVLDHLAAELVRRAGTIEWVGYLSTTGVYGDHGGEWISEDTPLAPNIDRAMARKLAEDRWLSLWREHGLAVHLFRLAGIYGPGRNALQSLLDGKARRIIKPGQMFSRIHCDDIAGILLASMAKPHPGRAYNCADNEPCPPQDVITYAAELLGVEAPPEEDFDTAVLSPMARSFYSDCKRVSNRRITEELGYRLHYPTYREGLAACLKTLGHPSAAPEQGPLPG